MAVHISYVLHFSLTLSRTRATHHIQMDVFVRVRVFFSSVEPEVILEFFESSCTTFMSLSECLTFMRFFPPIT